MGAGELRVAGVVVFAAALVVEALALPAGQRECMSVPRGGKDLLIYMRRMHGCETGVVGGHGVWDECSRERESVMLMRKCERLKNEIVG